jgi:dethiobiotin synthetase
VPRPDRLVVVSGTGTEVGKTWVAVRLVETLRQTGVSVVVRKPVQSFAAGDPVTDADLLAAASGEDPLVICPPHRRYAKAMAPPMAAASLGAPVPTVEDLVREIDQSWPATGVDIALVEGAGGVASPLAADGDIVDLARALHAELALLVADAGLGVINSCRLSVNHLAPLRTVAHLNRFDPGSELHRANAGWLGERDGLTVTTGIAALAALLFKTVPAFSPSAPRRHTRPDLTG